MSTLVQMHGPFAGPGELAPLTLFLKAQGIRVVDVRLRGFADGGEPSLEAWVDDLTAAVDDVEGDVILHGTSAAGAVAAAVAARAPDRIAGLVLTAAFVRTDLGYRLHRQIRRSMGEAYGRGPELVDLYTIQFLSRLFLDQERGAEGRDLLRSAIECGSDEIEDAVEGIDVRADLTRIAVPALVVAGRFDQIAPSEMGPSGAGPNEIAQDITGAQLETLDGGHLLAFEQPAQLGHLIADFAR